MLTCSCLCLCLCCDPQNYHRTTHPDQRPASCWGFCLFLCHPTKTVSAIQGQRDSNVYVKGPKEFSFVLYELRMNVSKTEQHLGFQTLQASFFSYNQAIKVKRTEASQEKLFSIVTLCYFISLRFCCILINLFFRLSAVLFFYFTFLSGSSNENS